MDEKKLRQMKYHKVNKKKKNKALRNKWTLDK